MDVSSQPDELIRHCDELRAQSMRMRATAAETREKSKRLIAAAAEAQEAIVHTHGWQWAGRMGSATAADLRAGR